MRRSRSKTKSKERRCPKCGGVMVNGVCTDCKYSSETAYRNRQEAKEHTFAG